MRENLLVETQPRLGCTYRKRKYHNLDREKEDMISIGVIGLIKSESIRMISAKATGLSRMLQDALKMNY